MGCDARVLEAGCPSSLGVLFVSRGAGAALLDASVRLTATVVGVRCVWRGCFQVNATGV